jgi:hypothetical protein
MKGLFAIALLLLILVPMILAAKKAFMAEVRRTDSQPALNATPTDADQCAKQIESGVRVSELAQSYNAVYIRDKLMYIFPDTSTMRYVRGAWKPGASSCAMALVRVLWEAGEMQTAGALQAAMLDCRITSRWDLSGVTLSTEPGYLERAHLPDGTSIGLPASPRFWIAEE